MASRKNLNPMRPNKTDEELENEFANYFLDRIEKNEIKAQYH